MVVHAEVALLKDRRCSCGAIIMILHFDHCRVTLMRLIFAFLSVTVCDERSTSRD
jgi:hypothetical protein